MLRGTTVRVMWYQLVATPDGLAQVLDRVTLADVPPAAVIPVVAALGDEEEQRKG